MNDAHQRSFHNPAAKAVGIIPARLASSRFPQKILASETGKPLIQHVWDAAMRAASLSSVVIAVDDPSVQQLVRSFGGVAVLTSPDHPNGTSRLAQAADFLRLSTDTIVVNIQGDEPDMDPGTIDAAVTLARITSAAVTTVASPFAQGEDPADPNIVKVVLRHDGSALYFSRALIPHARVGATQSTPPLKHVGLYAYRAGFLPKYLALAPTPLEQTEMLEQLRVLEHGYSIAVAVRSVTSTGIDTSEQYAAFVARWRSRQLP
jgi:3-deoxy-manno-octulosonate cytidylyltransferase (CMP-KDO synthetase)